VSPGLASNHHREKRDFSDGCLSIACRNLLADGEMRAMRFESITKATEAMAVQLRALSPRQPTPQLDDDLLAEELARCSECGRTPLLGEHVHLYEPTDVVCELCRVLRVDEPVSTTRVTHSLGPARRNDPAVVVRITRR
jgi:hypothetical protein